MTSNTPHPAAGRETSPDDVEFAPEYTTAERVRLLLWLGLPNLALMALLKFKIFPWLKTWLAGHPCGEIFGIDVQVAAFYAVFGLPTLLGIAGSLVLLHSAWHILRDGQFPPRGAKVWRPTPIRRGPAARRIGIMRLLGFLFTLLVIGYCLSLAINLVDSLVRENPTRCVLPLKNTI